MHKFCFVLVPGFSLVAVSCAIDALRAANHILEKPAYSWQVASAETRHVVSSSDIALRAILLHEAAPPDVIAICGGDQSHTYDNPVLTRWLHEQASSSVAIGSISDGAFVVAAAGLFDQCPSTIHWKCHDAYRERFPALDIKPSILEMAGKRFSCAGGTSSLDLMLHFIREKHGSDVTGRIADNYFHDAIRDGTRVQHITNAFRLAGRNALLADALLLMEENLESPMTISNIAKRLKISRRQLDRIFRAHVNSTPQQHYLELRIARASGLLLQTGMSVTEIAMGCGFQSASHLGKHFKTRFGSAPLEYRREHSVL